MQGEAIRQSDDGHRLQHEMLELGDAARAAAHVLASSLAAARDQALRAAAASLARARGLPL